MNRTGNIWLTAVWLPAVVGRLRRVVRPFLAGLFVLPMLAGTKVAGADVAIVPPETVGLSSNGLAAIRAHLQRCVDDGKIAGAVTLVGRRGKIAHFEAVGYRDLDSKQPMTRDALFRIASMTKVATAIAALSLLEEGRFALDDDAARFVPELKQCRVKSPAGEAGAGAAQVEGTVALQQPITIRDLLRHTSGLAKGPAVEHLFRDYRVWNEQDGLSRLVQALAQSPLAFQPGRGFRYGFSSDVLGHLLERVTKQRLDEVLRQRVFEPLQMNDTGFQVGPGQAGRLTSYYAFESGRLVCKEPATNSPFLNRPGSCSGGGGWPDGHAGLLATAADWWRLCEMIRQGGQLNGVRVLRPETVAAMITNQLGSIGSGFIPNRPGRGYGLSIGVLVDREPMKDPGSNGQLFWAGGPYNTYFFVDGEQEMVGILLVQTGPYHHLELMSRFNELAHQAIEAESPASGAEALKTGGPRK